MRVKDLQQLNVGGQYSNQVALVAALQLGGGQTAQHAKDLVPDECQQLEGDKVVAALLRVVEHAAATARTGSSMQIVPSATGAAGSRVSNSA